ncbi:MAG: hypothetical protein AVDCRST_MAG02-2348 [uncultured Rubrobacteraceae bacterium]|uniref:Saccharopine dehydrogenase NADP binding domain-containing protein n=1 Tax=uncultured Rubrobacteraceae bacterium TaxID=349277 RepID=A0A6J4R1Q6_9ACTN|nr:MAG: hypothetical protein AVDCRST_MAG02-2348 [uncultured Rubrobacteraceae bacterium]
MARRGRDGIVVLGGYGAVGRVACEILGSRFPGRVFAAGRDPGQAEAFSRETGGRVLPLGLDLADPREADRALDRARIAVACAGRDDIGFARACLERGVHYVDVSASHAFLKEAERLATVAEERGAAAVLSVGLAPGLTNLLARLCKDTLGTVRTIDIYVLIGMGEAHGEAAVRWTVENLDKRFTAPGAGGPREVGSLEDPKATIFPAGYGRRTAYRFDFPDQHVVSRTLGVEDVATRLCFDPAPLTRVLALLKRAGALRVLRNRAVREATIHLLTRVRSGSDGFAIKAEARGPDGRSFACSVGGKGEARATGVVAALAAESLYAPPTPPRPGVLHIEQFFEPVRFLGRVADHDLAVAF